MNATPALELHGVSKAFGTTVAVDNVDFALAAGEIHALVGENGAGKTTLANIAFGALRPDAGTVRACGAVGLVHQHFELAERLRVWENVLLGREPRRGFMLDRRAARAGVAELAARHGLDVDPDAYVESLPIAVRQRVELLRELAREPAVLLLDEPTAALAPAEIEALFVTLHALARGGTAIAIVTHKLAEVMDHALRVTVMRAGRVVARADTAQTNAAAIAYAMVGGEVPRLAPRAAVSVRPCFAVEALRAGTGAEAVRDVSFTVGGGEIVGIAGVEGNGQNLLADAISGTRDFVGTVRLGDYAFGPHDGPSARLARGAGFIPQDRRSEGLVLDWNVADNAALGRQRALGRGPALDRAAMRAFAQDIVTRFDVRPTSLETPVRSLSGGNQQKIVVGRALAGTPQFVLAYQPTRGIDVGAAALVHSRLIEARNAGTAILLVSFELDEIFALADRILVMAGGRIAGTFARDTADRARIGALMAGAA